MTKKGPNIEKVSLDLGEHEPWPTDVKLYQPYAVEQILLPDNANCLAIQAYLRMCNLNFEVEQLANAEAMSPNGKLPFLRAGRFVETDIVHFVHERKLAVNWDELDEENKLDLRAYMSLVQNVLEYAELYFCWCDNETYSKITSLRYGSVYPWPLNTIATFAKRRSVIKELKSKEWYKKTTEEVYAEFDKCCEALSNRLQESNYFYGDKPTELDAFVFGHLFTIFTTPLPSNELAKIVRSYSNLLRLVERVERTYFKKDRN